MRELREDAFLVLFGSQKGFFKLGDGDGGDPRVGTLGWGP